MPSKGDIASNSRMVDSLLISAQPVDLAQLALVALPDLPEQSLVLLEPLLGCLEADEGGCPYITGGKGVVEGNDVRRDSRQIRGGVGQVNLGRQAGGVFNVF